MESSGGVFFVGRRAHDGNMTFFEVFPADGDSHNNPTRIEATTVNQFCSEVQRVLKLSDPQIRAADGSPIESDSIFHEFDAFHIVDMDTKKNPEPIKPVSTDPKIITAGPAPYPILGNIPHLARSFGLQTQEMMKQYGPVLRLFVFGRVMHVTGDARVAQRILSDPQAFPKVIKSGPLYELRRLAGDGLFTASDEEENWGIAHRILMPAFSRAAIEKYHPEIVRASTRFLANLNKFYGSDRDIPLLNWTTKMTFDTIGICGFGHDFGSLETEQEAPAITWMVNVLDEARSRGQRGAVGNWLNIWAERRFSSNIANFHHLVEDILNKRRSETPEAQASHQDLLSLMLNSVDPQSKQKLSDLNMIYQCVTFLIAGHETTSTLLSWACFSIAQHPDVEQKLLDEIDAVLGSDPSATPTMQQISQLKYTMQIIKETLRMYPPVPAILKSMTKQQELEFADPDHPGQTKKGLTDPQAVLIAINTYALHHNPVYWGDDADKFNPDRWSPEATAERNKKNGAAAGYTWVPFSFGPRACIGMQFALLEAQIVLGMLFQKYVVRVSSNSKVTMQTTPSLTLRPENLFVRLHPRPRHGGSVPAQITQAVSPVMAAQEVSTAEVDLNLLILYGSNTGTCEDAAQKLGQVAKSVLRGTKVVAVKPLDEGIELLKQHTGVNDTVLVVTATYNGQPPDNCIQFNRWMDESHTSETLKGVKYAVLGVGNTQWVTFQAFPRKVDSKLEAFGAERIMGRGEIDVDSTSWEEPLMTWRTNWLTQLIHTFADAQGFDPSKAFKGAVEILPPAFVVEAVEYPVESGKFQSPVPGAQEWRILNKHELQSKKSDRNTIHMELALPEGVTYSAGDHLGVCPRNTPVLVQALASRLGLNLNQFVKLKNNDRAQASSGVQLPIDEPISIKNILLYYLDITSCPSMSSMAILAEYASDEKEKAKLKRLAGIAPDEYKAFVTNQWKTLLEVLVEFPSVKLPLDRVLDVLPRMQPRFYSISSSPLEHPDRLSITVGIEKSISPAGRIVDGVCSNYLHVLDSEAADTVIAYVRDLNNKAAPFRLPQDSHVPIIMIGAGTGIAPYMGFLQERRALLKNKKQELGRAVLIFGCRHPDVDFLYRRDLETFKADGAMTDLFTAFSRQSTIRKEYCQDVILQNGEELWKMITQQGARVYVCGSAGGLARGVRSAFVKLAQQYGNRNPELAERYMAAMEEMGYYLADVWG